MQVFVVLADYDREGYGPPEGVYTTRDQAESEMSRLTQLGYRGWEIFELTLDQASTMTD